MAVRSKGTWLKVLMGFVLASAALAKPTITSNSKSVEHADDYPLKELLQSQYFRLTTLRQTEIKDLRGFVSFSNDSKTIQCSFSKEKIPSNVKLELAKGSTWENNSGPLASPENIYNKDPNKQVELKVTLSKGRETLDLNCQFNNLMTGHFETDSDEEIQRSRCTSKGGVFTRYSRKDYDFACDFKLFYADLKKLFFSAGLQFESRREPPHIEVVVLGESPKPSTQPKKFNREPSSIKKKKRSFTK